MYRLASRGVVRLSDQAHILPSKSDPDWLGYQSWVKEGGTPDPLQPELEPLQSVYARLISKINQKRDKVEQTFFVYMDKPFDSNQVSVTRLTTTALAAQTAIALELDFPPVEWTCYDNTKILMTAEQLAVIPMYLAMHGGYCHEVATVKKEAAHALFLAEDRAGLENFDIETGWLPA